MKKSGLLTLCFSLWLLTGCSAQEIAEWNQKISDLGHQVSHTMNGGMQKREQREYDVVIPVDIDTAAARLRRYYGFEDVNAKIRALCQSGKESDQWAATAIAEESRGWEWEVTPGSYYKMGRIWENVTRRHISSSNWKKMVREHTCISLTALRTVIP